MTEPNHDQNLSEALESLRETVASDNTSPKEAPKDNKLNRDEIFSLPIVFQPRELNGRIAEDDSHIKSLRDAIGKTNKPNYLDPITVWWGGDRWYVIDGHHRLEAYDQAGVTKCIPVSVFKGAVHEAMAESALLNSKDRLVMRKDDKLNYAWKLVLVSNLSKKKIVEACAVSNGSVGNMRLVKERLLLNPEFTLSSLVEMSWNQARMEAQGGAKDEKYDPDAKMRERATRLAKSIKRAVGDRPFRDPETFALALTLLDDRLPGQLMETNAWHFSLCETVGELTDDLRENGEPWEQGERFLENVSTQHDY